MTKAEDTIVPFRWDLSQRTQLGNLVDGEISEVPDGYYDELRDVSTKVLARSQNSQLVFIGRSPEHIFDYLSGAFASLAHAPKLTLLQFSKTFTWPARNPSASFSQFTERERRAFLGYLSAVRIDPASIAHADHPVRFVDLVDMGTTFRVLLELYKDFADMQGADWNVVSKRMGFIGITSREKNSPNTYRWQQSVNWLEVRGAVSAKNVSTPWSFWGFAANEADKVTRSFHRGRWVDTQSTQPVHTEGALKALRRAVDVYDFAAGRAERLKFSRQVATLQEFKEPWLRKLALDLKTKAGS